MNQNFDLEQQQNLPYNNLNDIDYNEHHKQLALQIRMGFIRKVYCILTLQLSLTVLMSIVSMSSPSYLKWQLQNIWLLYLSIAISLIIMITLMCFPNNCKQVPRNYILLLSFTICESYLVSICCGLSSPKLVIMAALMTLAITIALTLYAFTTKDDFTVLGGALWIAGCVLLLFGLFLSFTQNNLLHIIMCCVMCVFYGFYIIYDTQLIVGGKKHELSTDDYIIGALMLYVDIIGLFLELLELLNRLNKE